MLASAAIARLRKTELKQLSSTAVPDADVLEYLNEAVLEIHKMSNLWQAEAIITLELGTVSYQMIEADTNVNIDLSDHILLVIDEIIDDEGANYLMNDEISDYGAATPQYDIIEFTEIPDADTAGDLVDVIYRAAPIDMTDVSDAIVLPPSFFEAMYFYVGFRAHVSQSGKEDKENNTHYKRFVNSMNNVNFFGLTSQDSVNSHKFENNIFP